MATFFTIRRLRNWFATQPLPKSALSSIEKTEVVVNFVQGADDKVRTSLEFLNAALSLT